MNIWIIKYGETVPFADTALSHHFFRAGELARRMSRRGHCVTWWTGRFEHQSKRFYRNVPATLAVPGTSISVEFLDSTGYKRNVSLARFIDHWMIARSFQRRIQRASRPDAILVSFPTLELADKARAYAQRHGVPLIVDVRDMWPDVITERIGEKLGVKLPPFLLHYNRMASRVLARADSVVSISKPFLRWAQRRGKRGPERIAADRVFHLSASRHAIAAERMKVLAARWRERGLVIDGSRRIFCWAGSLTDQATTRNLIEAMTRIDQASASKIQFVVCGKGDLEQKVAAAAKTHEHILFAGFIERDDVQYLYDHAQIGLLCYDNSMDFQASFPNKFGEYLMSGLIVLTSIRGLMSETFGNEPFLLTAKGNGPDELAAAIVAAASLTIDHSVGERAQSVFTAHFDADTVYSDYVDHIEQMVKGKGTCVISDTQE